MVRVDAKKTGELIGMVHVENKMKWIKVGNCLPTLGECVLIGQILTDIKYGLPVEEKRFWWTQENVYRPYDDDEKFNPEYYEFKYFSHGSKQYETERLKMEDFWCKVDIPVMILS